MPVLVKQLSNPFTKRGINALSPKGARASMLAEMKKKKKVWIMYLTEMKRAAVYSKSCLNIN
jgi:hypothetical protein